MAAVDLEQDQGLRCGQVDWRCRTVLGRMCAVICAGIVDGGGLNRLRVECWRYAKGGRSSLCEQQLDLLSSGPLVRISRVEKNGN